MNILATTDIYTVKDVDGVYRMAFAIAPNMARRGHRFDLALPCPDDEEYLRKNYPSLGFYFYRISGNKALTPFSMFLKSRKLFKRLLKERAYDIIVVSQPMSSMGPVLTGATGGVPVMYNFYSPWAAEFRVKTEGGGGVSYRARNLIEKAIIRRCDGVSVMSEYMREQLYEEHPELRDKPIRIVPGGVELEVFHPAADREAARKAVGFPEDRFVILAVRGLKPRTGVDAVIKAMPDIVSEHEDALLVLSGGGPGRTALEALVSELKLEKHVRFAGFIDEADLPAYYQAADISVMPSKALEGFGLSTVEALACGAPVVGTPVGGTVEILRGLDPGLLSEDSSSEALAERLIHWMGRRDELPAFRDRCAAYAAENYSMDKITAGYEDYYKELIKLAGK